MHDGFGSNCIIVLVGLLHVGAYWLLGGLKKKSSIYLDKCTGFCGFCKVGCAGNSVLNYAG